MTDSKRSRNSSLCSKLREIDPAVIESDDGNICQRGEIRRRQNAWEIGEVAASYGARCNLWSAFVGLRPDSRRTGGESIDIDSGSRTQEKTTAGFPVHRERPLSRTVASSDSSLRSYSFGQALYPLP